MFPKMATLNEVLHREISAYAGEWTGLDGKPSMFYHFENPADQIYCVVAPQTAWRKRPEVIMMAHIANDQIIIDIDQTDKPLREALRQAGIPDSQIVLVEQSTS